MSSLLVPPRVQDDEENVLSPSDTVLPSPTDSHSNASASRRDSRSTLAHPEGVEPKYFSEKKKDLEVDVPSAEETAEEKDQGDRFLVKWNGSDDPDNPHNWSRGYRWYISTLSAMLVLNATFASSIPSGIIEDLEKTFTFSPEVATLSISIFVAGYCLGPLIWGPLSDIVGRKNILVVSFALYTGWQVGCALSKNTASILVFRFLSGACASSPLTVSGSILGDIWSMRERSAPMSLFTVSPIMGPAIAPLVSGFIHNAGVSWRWVFWVLTIYTGVCLLFIVFTLPETFAPILLKKKAQKLRKETGEERWHSAGELEKISAADFADRILLRPWRMLVHEPMLIAITAYMSFIYGVLYLLFEAYPIIFAMGHGMSPGILGLMYLPIGLGGLLSCIITILVFNPIYNKKTDEYAARDEKIPPEARLLPAIVGGPTFAIAIFWISWTSYPSVSFYAPAFAGVPFAAGLNMIFLSCFNYMIDVYLANSGSALAANTVCRSMFGAGFPLFASQMYNTLTPQGAGSLLGGIALLLMPIPVIFTRYGATLRARSANAMS